MHIPTWVIRSYIFVASIAATAFGIADHAASIGAVAVRAQLPFPLGFVLAATGTAVALVIIARAVYECG